jgi:arylformamidase
MKIIDISVPIYSGMVFYPGDPGAEIEPVRSIEAGDVANLSGMHIGSHTGTHIDASRHFINGGISVDRIPLDVLIGETRVIDLTGVASLISREDLEKAGAAGSERLLLKTRNSSLWTEPRFVTDYVSLDKSAADFLVENEVRLVGIDYLSIERFKPDEYYVHHRLLEKGIVVLEGVDLSEASAGIYELACLPLKIRDGDGAPVRAVLIDREG